MAKTVKHSAWYEKAKEKYESGKWSAEMIRTLAERGIITEAEAAEILGDAA